MQLNIVFAILGLCAAVQETSTSRNANSGLLSRAAATRVSQATAFSEVEQNASDSSDAASAAIATENLTALLQEFKNHWTHPDNRNKYLLSALKGAELSTSPTRDQVLDLLNGSPPMDIFPTADDWKKVVKAIEKHLVESFFMKWYYPTVEAREFVFKSLMTAKELSFSLTQEKFVDVDTFLDQEFGEKRITVVQALRQHIDAVDDATDEEPLVAAFFAVHQSQETRRAAFVQWMNDEEIPVISDSFDANDVTPGDAFLVKKSKTLAIFGSNQDAVFYALRKYVDTKRLDIMVLLIVTLCFTLAYSISWFIKFRLDDSKKRASVGCDLFAAFGSYTIPHWFAIFFISVELCSPGAMRTGALWLPGILYTIYIFAFLWYNRADAAPNNLKVIQQEPKSDDNLEDKNNEDKKKLTKALTSFVIYCSFLVPLYLWIVTMYRVPPVKDQN
jgi:hypothetical protein